MTVGQVGFFSNTSKFHVPGRNDPNVSATSIRGAMTYENEVYYDSKRNITYCSFSSDSIQKGFTALGFNHNTKNLSELNFFPFSGAYDTHMRGGFFLLKNGDVLVHRTERHNDPFRTWTGDGVENVVDNGLSGDTTAYIATYYLQDSLYLYCRATLFNGPDTIKNRIFKSSDNGQSWSMFHDVLNLGNANSIAPYPTVIADNYNQSIVYYFCNERRFIVTDSVNFYRIFGLKSTDNVTFSNLEGSFSTTSEINYSTLLDTFVVDQCSDSLRHYMKICGAFVDENDDLFFTYFDTEASRFYFSTLINDTITTKEIPSIRPTIPTGSFLNMINDFCQIIPKGGDSYDLIVYTNSSGVVNKYSTTDAFDTISAPTQISPKNFTPTIFRGPLNYIPNRGNPYTVWISGVYDGITDQESVFVYEYYPDQE